MGFTLSDRRTLIHWIYTLVQHQVHSSFYSKFCTLLKMNENEGSLEPYDIKDDAQIQSASSNTGTEFAVIVLLVVILAVAVGGFLYRRKTKNSANFITGNIES